MAASGFCQGSVQRPFGLGTLGIESECVVPTIPVLLKYGCTTMGIGQLLKNIVEWLKRWLLSTQKQAPKPFVSVREKRYPLGLLKLVEGRDTSHAVRTWIISPTASQHGMTPLDLHIYLDFIGVTADGPSSHKAQGGWGETHTITILRASHTLQRDGTYTYDHIFSRHYDFQGQHSTPADVQARIACDRIAVLAGMRLIPDLEWPDEVEEIYLQVMGRDGLPNTQAYQFWRKSSVRAPNGASSNARHYPRNSSPSTRSSARVASRYSMNNAHAGKRKVR